MKRAGQTSYKAGRSDLWSGIEKSWLGITAPILVSIDFSRSLICSKWPNTKAISYIGSNRNSIFWLIWLFKFLIFEPFRFWNFVDIIKLISFVGQRGCISALLKFFKNVPSPLISRTGSICSNLDGVSILFPSYLVGTFIHIAIMSQLLVTLIHDCLVELRIFLFLKDALCFHFFLN